MSKAMDEEPMIYKDLINRYTEPHRFYHNLGHIGYMIQAIDKTKDFLDFELTTRDREILIDAIVYHDAVYNIVNEDGISNEQKSYEYYLQHSMVYDEKVAEMILASEHHFTDREFDDLTSYFLDLDLANIALEDRSEVDRTDQLIIREFTSVHHRNEVLKGRKKFVIETMQPKARLRAINDQAIAGNFHANIDYLAKFWEGSNA